MQFFEEKINVEEIDDITMYKMIYWLLKYDRYEAKCLVNLFLEKRTNEEELKVLNIIKKLLTENEIQQINELLRNKMVRKRYNKNFIISAIADKICGNNNI